MTKLRKPLREDYNSEDEYRKAMNLFNLDWDLIYGQDDVNEDGELLSCCGDVLNEDNMICPTCFEHC